MNKKEIEQALRDYRWMLHAIEICQRELNKEETFRFNVTAQYGIEASMPKGQGTTSDPVAQEVVRRDKYWERVRGYEEIVREIQQRIPAVTNVREKEVLHWLLEGKSYSWIARYMSLSERHIRRLKDSIVLKMSEMPSLPNSPKKPKTSRNCI